MAYRIDEAVEYEILDMYQSGVAIVDIAAECGVTSTTIYRVLRDHNITLRSAGGGSGRGILEQWGEEVLNEFLADYFEKELPLAVLSEKYGIHQNSIYTILRVIGRTPRTITHDALREKADARDHAVRLYRDGLPIWQIEVETGVSQPLLHRELHKRGVKLRQPRR